MPNVFSGRSLTCPVDASTLYLPFKYLVMVFALEGDSTMIKSIKAPQCLIVYYLINLQCTKFVSANPAYQPFNLQHGTDGRAAGVLLFAPAALIAYGNNRCGVFHVSHPFCENLRVRRLFFPAGRYR